MDELKLKTALVPTEDTDEDIAVKGSVIDVRPIYKPKNGSWTLIYADNQK